jgi:alpha-tubulin suppressor-like RCC1 family protein
MRSHRRIQLLFTRSALTLLLAACSDRPLGTPTSLSDPSAEVAPAELVVSDPARDAGEFEATRQPGLSGSTPRSSAGSEIAYVSLAAGGLPAAIAVTIRNHTTGAASSLRSPVVNGGFDPIAVAASAGDEIELGTAVGTGALLLYRMVVPKRRAPKVVRTSPPKGATDVAVNTQIIVVFTEPISLATVTSATVRLLQGTSPVRGTLRPAAGSSFAVEFVPDVELKGGTTYRLVVTKGILDADGDALDEEVDIGFTTLTSISGARGATIVAGWGHTCVLQVDGSVSCWGGNSFGQLGAGNDLLGVGTCPAGTPGSVLLCSTVPVTVGGGHTFSSLAAGFEHTCALTAGGDALCWGTSEKNHSGEDWPPACDPSTGACQCISSNGSCNGSPFPVGGNIQFGSLVAGYHHSCGIRNGGTAYCWGNELFVGMLGTGAGLSPSPAAVSGGIAFAALASGAHHMCALDGSGAAYCWGLNLGDQLGFSGGDDCDGPASLPGNADVVWPCSRTPVPVGGGLTFASLMAGWQHTCGLTSSGRAYCWGDHVIAGPFGDTPRLVDGNLAFVSISSGAAASHTCGVTAANVAYCWGENGLGQLGDGTTTSTLAPVRVAGGLALSTIAVGAEHSCALTTASEVYCWGSNRTGQLGMGYASPGSTVPIRVSGQ